MKPGSRPTKRCSHEDLESQPPSRGAGEALTHLLYPQALDDRILATFDPPPRAVRQEPDDSGARASAMKAASDREWPSARARSPFRDISSGSVARLPLQGLRGATARSRVARLRSIRDRSAPTSPRFPHGAISADLRVPDGASLTLLIVADGHCRARSASRAARRASPSRYRVGFRAGMGPAAVRSYRHGSARVIHGWLPEPPLD
jgi:hypothetical protein